MFEKKKIKVFKIKFSVDYGVDVVYIGAENEAEARELSGAHEHRQIESVEELVIKKGLIDGVWVDG